MAFVIDDNMIWASTMGTTLFFSALAVWFPIRLPRGEDVTPGKVWLYLRAMAFPLFASVSWYIMAAFSVAAGNSGTHILYYYYWMFCLVYLFVFFPMTVYLAFRPVIDVLEGREKLENG